MIFTIIKTYYICSWAPGWAPPNYYCHVNIKLFAFLIMSSLLHDLGYDSPQSPHTSRSIGIILLSFMNDIILANAASLIKK